MKNTSISAGTRRVVLWDGDLWFRTYTPGGFDGYRTLKGRRLPCDTLERRVLSDAMQRAIDGEVFRFDPQLPPRTRLTLWRDRQIDRLAIALVERGHVDAGERVWRWTGKW